MNVKIRGFKVYVEKDYEINRNEMTLIKAESGMGKSTIFQAILWCMYGNMRNIYNNNGATKKLSVELYIEKGGVIIFRKKNPELLRVTIADKVFEDEVAQEEICKLYGSRKVFYASSYIEQKGKCDLLCGTAQEKLELLNELSFTGDSPRYYITKINEYLKSNTHEYEKQKAVFSFQLESYTKELDEFYKEKKYKSEDEDVLRNSIVKNIELYNELTEKLISQEKVKGQIYYLENENNKSRLEMNKLKKEINLPNLPTHDIDTTEHTTKYTEFNEFNEFEEEEIFIPVLVYNEVNLDLKVKIESEVYKQLKNKLKTDYTSTETKEEFLRNEIKNLETIVNNLYYKIGIIEENQENKQNELCKIQEEYIQFIDTGKNNLKQIEIQLEFHRSELANLKDVKDIKEVEIEKIEVEKIEEIEKIEVDENIIWKTESIERQINDNIEILNKLDLVYKLESIQEKIEEIEKFLKYTVEMQKNVQLYYEVIELEKQLKSLNYDNSMLDKYKRLYEKITEDVIMAEKCTNLLTCPKCDTSLSYKNNFLELSDNKPIEMNSLLHLHTEKERVMTIYNDLQKQNATDIQLRTRLDNINIDKNEIRDFINNVVPHISEYEKVLLELKKIKYVQTPKYKSAYLKNILIIRNQIKDKERLILKFTNEYNLKAGDYTKKIEQLIIDLKYNLNSLIQERERKTEELKHVQENFNTEILILCEYRNKINTDMDELENLYNEEILRTEQNRILSENAQLDIEKQKTEINYLQKKEKERKERYNEWLRLKNIRTQEKEKREKIEKEKRERREKREKEYREKLDLYNKQIEENLIYESNIKILYSDIELNRIKIIELESSLCNDLNEKLKDTQRTKSELERELFSAEKYLDWLNRLSVKKSELEKLRDILLQTEEILEHTTELKLKAQKIEIVQLEDCINNINTVLKQTLEMFFSDPITLTLHLFKKNKDGNIKPGLNLDIQYHGCKYDDVNSLSGGESDRISLALLIALNYVSNSPFILMDECVSSLDGDLKENCISCIKNIEDKTVIIIDHDTTMEGFYDQVLEIF